MISSLLASFSRLSVRPTTASSSACLPVSARASTSRIGTAVGQIRHAAQLAPKRTKYKKAHKGRVPIPFGGSLKGTTLTMGEYGIRVLAGVRLSAKQLHSAQTALKRKLRVIKGSQVFMRVFPDIPVCVKGNETRMGKGKGTFEYWACRAPIGRVIFEIGGAVDIRPEVAKEALRLASAKLPVPTEFITRASAPRLGNLIETQLPPHSAVGTGGAPIRATEAVTSTTISSLSAAPSARS